MPDYTGLQTSIAAMVAEVEHAKGIQASAKALLLNSAQVQKDAVTAALQAQGTVDQGSIDAANAAIDSTTASLVAQVDDLATALVANPAPPVPPPTPATT